MGSAFGSIAADKPDISTPSLQSPDSTHASEPADVELGGSDAAKGEGGAFATPTTTPKKAAPPIAKHSANSPSTDATPSDSRARRCSSRPRRPKRPPRNCSWMTRKSGAGRQAVEAQAGRRVASSDSRSDARLARVGRGGEFQGSYARSVHQGRGGRRPGVRPRKCLGRPTPWCNSIPSRRSKKSKSITPTIKYRRSSFVWIDPFPPTPWRNNSISPRFVRCWFPTKRAKFSVWPIPNGACCSRLNLEPIRARLQ